MFSERGAPRTHRALVKARWAVRVLLAESERGGGRDPLACLLYVLYFPN